MDKLTTGLLWYVAFIFSTTLHEASHAFAALKLGDDTAYNGGHVTLDPIPHMKREPIGTIVVPIISFILGGWMIGWASVPYNYNWALNYPRRSATMSIAGPAANLLLVLVSALLIRTGIMLDIFVAPETINFTHIVASTQSGFFSMAAEFLNVLFSLNLILFLFNLLPIPPLDGSGIIPFFLSKEHAVRYLEMINHPSFGFIGIFIAWKLFDVIYDPLHLTFINILYWGVASYS
jgi:Zn-dependent protease